MPFYNGSLLKLHTHDLLRTFCPATRKFQPQHMDTRLLERKRGGSYKVEITLALLKKYS